MNLLNSILLILTLRVGGESSWGFSNGVCAETRQTENPKMNRVGKTSLVNFVTSFRVVWLSENVCVLNCALVII